MPIYESSHASTNKQPHILFITCDQLRHDWLGYNGAEHVRTPNIDRIAAMGTYFTQAVTNSPACAPARIGLATGLRPHRVGALDNHSFLPLSRETYYQRLRNHGYQVGCVGKLDLAKPDGYNGRDGRRPLTYAWGFTDPLECEGKIHAGRGNPPNGPYTKWLHDHHPTHYKQFIEDYESRADKGAVGILHDSVVPFGLCEDDFIGQKACEVIENFSDEFPWHLFVSFVGPHNPYDPAPEYAHKWRDADMPDPIPCDGTNKPPGYGKTPAQYHDPEKALIARRQYTAYLEQIDFRIGEILDTLERQGALDSTYIIFSADHGEMLGDHGRYTKGVQYEASVRVPMIAAGPGIKTQGSDALVELNDLASTICELAHAGDITNADSKSLMPVLTGATNEHRPYTFSTHRGTHCVRTREWKYIRNDADVDELYDLINDPDERHNVIEAHPTIIREMTQQYVDSWTEGGALA